MKLTIVWEPLPLDSILEEVRARRWAAFLMQVFRGRAGAVFAALMRDPVAQ